MKVPFSLTARHNLILRTLYEVKELPFDELRRVIRAVEATGQNFDEFVKTITKKQEPSFLPVDPDRGLKKDVIGLEFLGLLEMPSFGIAGDRTISDFTTLRLSKEGIGIAKRIKEGRRVILRPSERLRDSIFVACAFGKREIDRLYEKQLEPACESLGYKPVRVDMSEPPQTITESIIKGITECQCILADLTHARPSVYFEVGFAQGLGIPSVLTCRKDHYRGRSDGARVHFDLEQYKISFWSRETGGEIRWPKRMEPSQRLRAAVPSRKE